MSILRFLGLDKGAPRHTERGDSDTVRRIAAQLERLDPDEAKYLAGFSYVLARIADADLDFDASEVAEMERIVATIAHLSESEAALVVQIARSQTQLLGGTEWADVTAVNVAEH